MSESVFRHRDSEVDAYLSEIRGVPLLTAQEERNLAVRLKRMGSKNEEVRRDALEAREQFVKANLRLVVNIARAFRNRGLPFSVAARQMRSGVSLEKDRSQRKLITSSRGMMYQPPTVRRARIRPSSIHRTIDVRLAWISVARWPVL